LAGGKNFPTDIILAVDPSADISDKGSTLTQGNEPMNAATFQNCPDFSTSLYAPTADQVACNEAFDASGLPGRAFNQFSQGWIHAKQGRTDLLSTSPAYDAGYNAR
jgi:hypothetical protein